MTPAARLAAAAEVLDRIAQSRAPADEVLQAWGRANRYAGSKDRRAVGDRVYRVLRERARLAWAAGAEDGRSLVLASLALIDGAHMKEIEALYSGGGYGPAPLTEAERARLGAAPGEPPGWVAAGLPPFVGESFRASFGENWAAEADALLGTRAPIDLRVNGAKASVEAVVDELASEGLHAQRTPFSAWGLRLLAEPPPNIQELSAFREGRIEIQDEGSQIAAGLAGAEPGTPVIDSCAGGGGKTLALAASQALSPRCGKGWDRGEPPQAAQAAAEERGFAASTLIADPSPINGEGRLIACDVHPQRLAAIRPRLERAGVSAELRSLGPNGEGLNDLEGAADLVFVDAPCSGSGTWRRRPEEAWRLTPERVAEFHALQVKILARAARLVRPGGRLVYVTCSVLDAENGATADAFQREGAGFTPVSIAAAADTPHLTEAARERLRDLADGSNRLQLTPRRTNTDGFYAALWQRAS